MKTDFEYLWTDKKRTFLGFPISFTRFFITETKLVTRKGFFTVTEDEIELYKITDKKLVLPFGQRLFGCGTILIHSKDVDTPTMEIKCVKKPRDVISLLDKHVNIQRDKYCIRGRDMYGAMDCNHEHGDADEFDIFDET